uniref:Actin-related protein 2/3 complex subunit 5 n=1 Tax=Panagrolaimus sp. PS1159 TaxID=55785 RepID=A0AC35G644_9BILA
MSKNVLSDTSYRKLKVEDLDANAFHGDEEVEEVEGPNEARIKQLTQGGQQLELLRELIKNAPLKSNNQNLKDQASQMAATALSSFKMDDVGSTISKLSTEELDILLHYVFRAFDFVEQQKISANVLLTFHDEIFKITGHGGILRVLCSINRLQPL